MKTLLVAALVGVFLFSGSAAVSWFLMNQQQQIEAEKEPVEEKSDDPMDDVVPVAADIETAEKMPVAIRPGEPMTQEILKELSRSVNQKELRLAQQAKEIEKEKNGLRLLFADLEREREELTGFANSVESRLRAVRELHEKTKIEAEKIAAFKAAKKTEADAPDKPADDDAFERRVKFAKKYFGTMDVSDVATFLKQAADSGDLEFAGRVLAGMDQRRGGKVLSSLKDPILADQLLKAAGAATK